VLTTQHKRQQDKSSKVDQRIKQRAAQVPKPPTANSENISFQYLLFANLLANKISATGNSVFNPFQQPRTWRKRNNLGEAELLPTKQHMHIRISEKENTSVGCVENNIFGFTILVLQPTAVLQNSNKKQQQHHHQ